VLFCLRSGSGTPDFAQEAFSTNANAAARELTVFLQGAIAQGIATVPAPSAGSGETFRLSALGVPVRNEESSLGPILADRAFTLGRGKFLVGANLTTLQFEQLRGVSLDALSFNVVQRDLPPAGPPLGDPAIERTYLAVSTRMGCWCPWCGSRSQVTAMRRSCPAPGMIPRPVSPSAVRRRIPSSASGPSSTCSAPPVWAPWLSGASTGSAARIAG
jgi:hypothetical protein